MHAAGINRADVPQRKGTYPSPAGWPEWPGLELAGKVAALGELVERGWPKIEAGEIRPSVYRTLPLPEANDAHAILERGENIGKVVLTVR